MKYLKKKKCEKVAEVNSLTENFMNFYNILDWMDNVDFH